MSTETDFPRPPPLSELEAMAFGTGTLDVKKKLAAAKRVRQLREQEAERILRAKARQSTDASQ